MTILSLSLPVFLSLPTVNLCGALLLDKMATSAKSEVSQSVRAPAAGKVHYPFWFGGSASCFAAGVTHPLDLGTSILYIELRTEL